MMNKNMYSSFLKKQICKITRKEEKAIQLPVSFAPSHLACGASELKLVNFITFHNIF